MDSAGVHRDAKRIWDLLLGLQLGVFGGLLMLAWSALLSPLLGKPWWLVPNLFASQFYNSGDLYLGPGIATLVGAALQVFTSGIVGAVNGLATPGGRLSGISTAVAWYLLCLLFVWKRIAPMMSLPSIQPLLWTGYIIFGSTLGWHRKLRARQELTGSLAARVE